MVELFKDNKIVELQEQHDFRPTGVIHVGAGSGNERGLYDWLGVKYGLWIEALEERIPVLKERLPDSHLIHHTAIWEKEGPQTFYKVSPRWDLSSFMEPNFKFMRLPEQNVEIEEVSAFPLDDDTWYELTQDPYDLLTLDCQGAEEAVLKGASATLDIIRFVMTVIWKRQVYKGCLTSRPFDELMASKGFSKIHTVWSMEGPWGWALYGKEQT